jgi:hypothetical protein
MAVSNKIRCRLTTIHKLTPEEEFFVSMGSEDFALFIREFRHQNPYIESSREFILFNDQARFNIPFLIIFSHELNQILLKENRDTLLFTTRDCCLLKHIFSTMYPNYKSITFQASRRMYFNYNDEYKNYIRSVYDDDKCLIVDLHGSFHSGRQLFMEVFGKLPRIHIAVYYIFKDSPKFEALSFSFNHWQFGVPVEEFNADTQGTLINMKDGNFIRHSFEFIMSEALIYKDTTLKFCEFIRNKHIPEFKDLNRLLEIFTSKCCFNPSIKRLIQDENIAGLEKLFITSDIKRKTLGFTSNAIFRSTQITRPKDVVNKPKPKPTTNKNHATAPARYRLK